MSEQPSAPGNLRSHWCESSLVVVQEPQVIRTLNLRTSNEHKHRFCIIIDRGNWWAERLPEKHAKAGIDLRAVRVSRESGRDINDCGTEGAAAPADHEEHTFTRPMKHLICLLASSLLCIPLVAGDHFTSAREAALYERRCP